ncbi:hypothetical protein [Streptomyces sp. NPDC058385]|uniref:hypothetical protein n=1 Tax=Streptomyces sp. NPDC058385 TaxID=3346473 RepID=UPI003664B7D2
MDSTRAWAQDTVRDPSLAGGAEAGELCRLVGGHCKSGDTLSTGVPLADPRVGDLIAVPVTGAHTYALSNNYNDARRPPVVRRETYADLMRRDLR